MGKFERHARDKVSPSMGLGSVCTCSDFKKENELAPEQVVEPVVASNATDGLGQMELPIAEAMRDADLVIGEASDACVGSGSVDTQTRRLDFWSTSRDSGPTATVSYRRRRPYTAPDASTEDVAPEESMEATASEALTESDAPEAPIEAMPSEATTEAVAEAPAEVLATDEPAEAAAQDGVIVLSAQIDTVEGKMARYINDLRKSRSAIFPMP
ncbi:hypothetical protein [Cupriavidus sp. DF5525]|uniref:hypothetical protein n=1 Tax=Cupriavidus sp. DF5525 TaxID=3160989 RepID=UPI0032DF93EE